MNSHLHVCVLEFKILKPKNQFDYCFSPSDSEKKDSNMNSHQLPDFKSQICPLHNPDQTECCFMKQTKKDSFITNSNKSLDLEYQLCLLSSSNHVD